MAPFGETNSEFSISFYIYSEVVKPCLGMQDKKFYILNISDGNCISDCNFADVDFEFDICFVYSKVVEVLSR